MRTPNTQAINSKLEIVRLNGQKFPAVNGYYQPTGYVLKHSEFGYFAFQGDECPYSPVGGKSALQSILDANGFLNFDNVVWLRELK